MNHAAIYATHPTVAKIDDSLGAFDIGGNIVEINDALISAWVDQEAYKNQRAREYPPITDYLDGVVKGDQAQIDQYIAACQAVKAKYPKA